MGGGGINNSQNQLNSITGTQIATGTALGTQGQSLISQGQGELAPIVQFLQGITQGNSTDTQRAIAPALSTITAQTNTNRENIYDTTAPGAGRDVLLGQNKLNEGNQVASTTNNAFLSAFPELAQIATGQTQAGLGLTGQGITSTGNAASTTGAVLNSQEQQKASTLNLVGSLAGAAGAAFGGTDLTKLCWVAEAVYGVDDVRTYMVRGYLNGPFGNTFFGRIIVSVYRSIGRQIAWAARRSWALRCALKPLFDLALARATRD